MKISRLKSKASVTTALLLAIAGLFASSSAVNAVSTNNLFFYINAGDPGSYSVSTPTIWTDLSSAGRNGTIYNSPTFDASTSSFNFSPNTSSSDNASAKYVDMGDGFNNFGSGITIEFEAHFGSVAGNWERIFDFGNGQEADNIWVGNYYATNEIAIELWQPNQSNQQVATGRCRTADSVDSLTADTFKKYVITLDGNLCRIYVNGVEVNTVIDGPAKFAAGGGSSSFDVFYDDTSKLGSTFSYLPNNVLRTNNYIGKSNWGVDRAFDGAIKYVRIYTEALSASDVTNNAATYTLTYSTSGADTGTAPSAKTGNGLITLDGNTGTLVKAGHVFQGWATSANQATAISGSYNLIANTTLYPAFLPNTYSVTYEENGGSTVSDGTFTHGGTLTFPATPTRNGYTFLGWFANATGGTALSASTVASGNASVTLHAQWTAVANSSVSSPSTNTATVTTTAATLAKTGIETLTMVFISFILLGIGVGLTQIRRLENR